jgi:hypothetical protein
LMFFVLDLRRKWGDLSPWCFRSRLEEEAEVGWLIESLMMLSFSTRGGYWSGWLSLCDVFVLDSRRRQKWGDWVFVLFSFSPWGGGWSGVIESLMFSFLTQRGVRSGVIESLMFSFSTQGRGKSGVIELLMFSFSTWGGGSNGGSSLRCFCSRLEELKWGDWVSDVFVLNLRRR